MSDSKFDATAITLQSAAVIIEINISNQSGSKLDRAASAEIAAAKHSSADVATDAYRVSKVIFNKDYLQPIKRISLKFYKDLRAKSHEWARGQYIIKAEALHDVLSDFQKAKVKYDAAKRVLVSQMDEAHADYKKRAGTGYDEALWPTADEVSESFVFEIRVEQLPDLRTSNAIIAKIGQQLADDVTAEREKRHREKSVGIAKETAKRVADVVEKIVTAMSDSEAKFKDTIIGNLNGLVELIDVLNITGDPAITAIKDELQQGLCNADPAELRTDEKVRKDTAAEAKRMLRKIRKLS